MTIQHLRNLAQLVAAALITCSTVAQATGSQVAVAGTQVLMAPPQGFSPASTFPGFENRDAASTIIVAEIPVGFEVLRAGLTAEALLQRGMVVEQRADQQIADSPGEIIRIQQNAPNGVTYRKWLAIFGDDEKTVMLTAGAPIAKADELGPALLGAIKSASWLKHTEVGDEGLLFRMDGPAGLDSRQRFLNNLAWSDDETDGLAPMLIVGNSFLSPAETPLEEFARLRLAQTEEIRDLGEASATKTELDGLAAVELLANAKDSETGEELTVYQVIAFDGDIYYLIQGFFVTEQPHWIDLFRDATKTFRRAEDEP